MDIRASSFRKVAVFTGPLGLALLAVVGRQNDLTALWPISSAVFTGILIAGIVSLCIAVFSFLVSLLELVCPDEPNYFYERVKRSDLKELHRFLRGILGDAILPERGMREFYDRNPNIFYAVYLEKKSLFGIRRKLVGHFSVAAVTPDTKKLLAADNLKGTDFKPSNLCTKKQQPSAFYIGAIAAQGRRARAETITCLMQHLLERTRKAPLVYTRPVTKDGLRLARKYRFRPVRDAEDDERLDMTYSRDFTPTQVEEEMGS